MSLSFEIVILIDIFLTVACGLVLLSRGRVSATHPAAPYFFFHLYTVSTRLWSLAKGAPTLFSWGFPFDPVREEEIIRAALLMDLALVIMTIAWVIAARQDLKKHGPLPALDKLPRGNLSKNYIWLVVLFALPIGLVATFYFARLPGVNAAVDLGAWSQSSWLAILPPWFGLSLLALIYWYGLRKPLIFLMSIYLLLMAYQGFNRFRVVIPIILMAQIYLDRKNRRWPTVSVAVILVIAGLLFFPLKSIGRGLQEGASVSEVTAVSGEIISSALAARAGDQTFLDMFASSLTLTDLKGEFTYGKPYLAVLTLPVPRQLWPDKPTLSQYLFDISTSWRPMGQAGMIVTYLGEAYINFSYAGILLMPFLIAYILGIVYFRAYRRSYYSVYHFAYLLIACNLIQVYRDGLISLAVFLLVNMMPLIIIIALHIVNPASHGRYAYRRQKASWASPATPALPVASPGSSAPTPATWTPRRRRVTLSGRR